MNEREARERAQAEQCATAMRAGKGLAAGEKNENGLVSGESAQSGKAANSALKSGRAAVEAVKSLFATGVDSQRAFAADAYERTERDISAQKQALRRACRAKAAALPRFGTQFCAQLTAMPAYQSAGTVFCYVGIGWEIDTQPFLQRVLADGKTLCVPKCAARGVMTARHIAALAQLEAGAYGLAEPPEGAEIVPPADIDFVVLPCVAAARNGFRLGQGGGYYDRFLPLLSAACTTAVLCRSALLLPWVPAAEYDLPAQYVITETAGICVQKR